MNTRKYDVSCIGFSTVDEVIEGIDVKKLVTKPVYPAKDAGFGVGGDALNEATVLARLGLKTSLATKLGGDFLADIVKTHCRREKISDEYIVIDPSLKTTMGIAVVGQEDERRIIPVAEGRSVDKYAAEEIPNSLFVNSRIISFASLFVVPLMTDEKLAQVFRKAKAAGCIVCCDVKMTGSERLKDVSQSLSYVDFIFPNFAEARLLTGEREPEKIAQKFLEEGVGTVVLKLGTPGSYIRNEREEYWIPSYEVDAVDSTGAGDNFAAGFIAGLVEEKDLVSCAKLASAASSCCVQAYGAVSGVKNREQLLAIIREGASDWERNSAQVAKKWVVNDSKGML